VTMIDEEEITRLLLQLGDTFEVSDEAQAVILEKAAPEPHRSSDRQERGTRIRSMASSIRERKGSLVAASLVLLVAVGITLVVALPDGSVGRTGNAGSAHGESAAPKAAPTPLRRSAAPGAPSVFSGSTGTGSIGSPPSPGGGGGGSTETGGPPTSSKTVANPQVPPSQGQSAKVVATGTVDLIVKNGSLQSVLADLTQLAASYGGFVASTQAQYGNTTPPSPPSATIALRIPETSFGSAVSQAQRYGKATSVNTTSNDVTSQYVNLQARIAAAQASLTQYLSILRQATTIPNILTVQSQIDSIQSNIEQMQGQLNVLNNETTYGTLTVSLTEPGPTKPKQKPKPKPKRASKLVGTRAWRFARRRTI
jgi:hypothetical protein